MQSHAHGHHDHAAHNHAPGFRNITFSFVVAVVANLAFTLIEGVYALITDSASLLADAGHNLSDVLGLLLAWGAAYLATKESSRLYSYGLRRTTIFAAITNAVLLFIAAAYISLEALDKLLNPTAVPAVVIMVVAFIGIFVNAGAALLFRAGSKSDLNLRGAYLHLGYDALSSVGVLVAAAAMYFTGWLWLDGLVGLVIVLVICWGSWGLLRDSVNLLLDAVPQHIDRDAVYAYLANIDGVHQVHDLHIWALGASETCLTAHLVMPETPLWDSGQGYGGISRVLKERFHIHHVTLQVERELGCETQDCD